MYRRVLELSDLDMIHVFSCSHLVRFFKAFVELVVSFVLLLELLLSAPKTLQHIIHSEDFLLGCKDVRE